jgi:type VI secretion system protein ImpL
MFLNPAQANFIAGMRALDVPLDTADTNSYLAAYNPLKAYLITTSHPNAGDIAGHPDAGDIRFLTPVFLQAWNDKRPVDPQQQPLAQAQIDFYGQDLLHEQPYTDIPPDLGLVEHTRVYLSRFLAETRIYQSMLIDADKASAPVDFNRQYPTTVRFVSDGHVVRGAFTRAGFDFMQNALKNPGHYAQGERWVLGDHGNQLPDLITLGANLTVKYESDFLNEWHVFLQNAHVANCGGLTEAPKLLDALTDPSSPLLELLFVVSHNTAVSDKKINDVFQPAQQVVDPNADKLNRFAGAGNKDYLLALSSLKQAIDQSASNPLVKTDATAFAPIAQAADSAENTVKQMGLTFNIDPEKDSARHVENLVKGLMLSPIDCIDKLKPSPGAALNAGGGKMCSAISPLLSKYPFANSSAVIATVPEIDKVFAPDTGDLWTNYNATLKPVLIQAGNQYVPAPAAPQPVNPKFVAYFNRAARVTTALYANGQKTASLSFTLRFLQGNGVGSATFLVDGQRIPSGITTNTFTWNGATAQNASLFFDGNEALQHQGTWALFQLVRQASTVTHIPGGYRLDYRIGVTVANQLQETGKTASFELTGPGAEFLVGDGFAGLNCVGPVVK